MTRSAGATVLLLLALGAAPAGAQELSTWVDASASRARPPANVVADATSYGLLGLRMRLSGTRSGTLELGLHGGRGAESGSGTWASGSAGAELARNIGVLTLGARADAFGLRYLTGLETADGASLQQSVYAASARPTVALSMGGFLLRAQGDLTRGQWRMEQEGGLAGGPLGGPLGSAASDGDITVTGGALSLVRVAGQATFEVTAERYDAINQLRPDGGIYQGIGGAVSYGFGAIDLSAGARHWSAPAEGGSASEVGYHAGIGATVGTGNYLQLALTRGVTDPMYGTDGSLGVSLGLSVRLGSTRVGSTVEPVEIGERASAGRTVIFRFRADNAQQVAVAGDFTGWQPRTMRKADDVWVTEMVLPAGVHHFSFVVNGDEWVLPDDAPGVVDDGFGRKNATVVVQ